MEHNGGDFDLQSVLPIQFNPESKRMRVRPRIDGPATEEVALRFLDEAVDSRQPDELILDLTGQPTITSSVLAAFVKYHRRGIEVILLEPSESVLDVLAYTMLIQFFQIHYRLPDPLPLGALIVVTALGSADDVSQPDKKHHNTSGDHYQHQSANEQFADRRVGNGRVFRNAPTKQLFDCKAVLSVTRQRPEAVKRCLVHRTVKRQTALVRLVPEAML